MAVISFYIFMESFCVYLGWIMNEKLKKDMEEDTYLWEINRKKR